MVRIVAGAVGAGAIDTASTLTKPTSSLKTSISNNLSSLSSSSSSSSSSNNNNNNNNRVSANYVAPIRPSCTVTSCFCHGETCTRLMESVDGRRDQRASGSFLNSIFGPVPSRFEVENAVTALQNFMHGISSSRSEFGLLQKMLFNYDSRILQSRGYGRVCDAFRLLQTQPYFQRVVVSLSSDKAVWDAVLNNKVVRELRESLCTAEEKRSQNSNEEPDLATYILRWILDVTKAKVIELIEYFKLFVNEIFQPPERENPTAETADQLEEKLRSSLLLTIVILLIVIVTRAQRV